MNNQDTFSTNDVDSQIACNPNRTYCGADLHSRGAANRFGLTFAMDYFPTSGSFEIITFIPGRQLFGIDFYYNNKFYYHTMSRIDTVYTSVINDKPSYTMPNYWFISYDDPTGDSILIQGTFNVP